MARTSLFLSFRIALGVLLLFVGLLALLTPFTPGSWLILVGAGLLRGRISLWSRFPPTRVLRAILAGTRLRRRWKRRMLGKTYPYTQAITAMENEVGKVVHYYDKLGVAIIELGAPLKVGDTIKVKRDEEEFEQAISSMQIEHAAVESGKKGDAVGIVVNQKTKEGAVVFKVTA